MTLKSLLAKPIFWFLLIFILGTFLRVYKLPEYMLFLGDEGRDVLVVKRMIVDHQFTLLGPTASVGGFYIGPLYYYMMAPFLWLSHLDPVGPAYLDVLFGLGFLVVLYLFLKNNIGHKGALAATFLAALSPQFINISRFSWNPNPVPFFALLTIFCLYLGVVKKQMKYIFLSGLWVGVLQQLHYIDLVFIPILGISLLFFFRGKKFLWSIVYAGLGFLLGYSLFLIFEIRHGFPNLKSVWEFATRGGRTVAPRSWNLIWLFNDIFIRTYEIVIGVKRPVIDLFYYASLISFALYSWANRSDPTKGVVTKLLLIWMIIGVLGVGSYQGSLYDHYFGLILPLPLIFISMLVDRLCKSKKIFLFICCVVVGILAYFEIKGLYIWHQGNNQVEQTKKIANLILDLSGRQRFNFALITPGNSDHAYRYFLDVWGYTPQIIENPQVDPQRTSVTDQLIVVCEQKACQPLGNPLWEVAGFGRAEIKNTVDGPAGITLYKLVHYTGK